MKKNFILSLLFVGLAAFTANAQTDGTSKTDTKSSAAFQPGWYIGLYTGPTFFFGDTGNHSASLKNWNLWRETGLTSNFAFGYDFNPILGLRIEAGGGLNRWYDAASKPGSATWNRDVRMYDIHLTADLTVNLSNAIAGYNPNRLFDLSVYGGIGMVNRLRSQQLDNFGNFKGADFTPDFRLGLLGTFHLSDAFDLNIDLGTNWMGDGFNGEVRGFKADISNTAQIGLTYHFGRAASAKFNAMANAQPKVIVDTVYKDRIITKEVPAAATAPTTRTMRVRDREFNRDVFFAINKTDINNFYQKRAIWEAQKFLNDNPSAKLSIDGYADKGTGTPKGNMRLSQARAKKVADVLTKQYKIDPSRIVVNAHGDEVQPLTPNEANRVTRMSSTAEISTTE